MESVESAGFSFELKQKFKVLHENKSQTLWISFLTLHKWYKSDWTFLVLKISSIVSESPLEDMFVCIKNNWNKSQ